MTSTGHSGDPATPALVMGMGTSAFGKERRAVSSLKSMTRLEPFFLISKWEDGSVSRLLELNQLPYRRVSFGYLGKSRPSWTLVNLVQMPVLHTRLGTAILRRRGQVLVALNLRDLASALPPLLLCKRISALRIALYLGDIPAQDRFTRWLGATANRLGDCFVANSEVVKRGMVAAGIDGEKIEVIYNGVEIERFEKASAIDFRRRFEWPSEVRLIAYAGQFNEGKGLMDFLQAASMVVRENPGCRFVLLGREGPAGDQRVIQEAVQRLGLAPVIGFAGWTEEIERAFAGCDVLVVPSRFADAAPNVCIEAMAAGLPVVATRVGGIPELIADGETGFLVEKQRPDLIAKCLQTLLESDSKRLRMGEAGRRRAADLFDNRKNASRLEEVLLHG